MREPEPPPSQERGRRTARLALPTRLRRNPAARVAPAPVRPAPPRHPAQRAASRRADGGEGNRTPNSGMQGRRVPVSTTPPGAARRVEVPPPRRRKRPATTPGEGRGGGCPRGRPSYGPPSGRTWTRF